MPSWRGAQLTAQRQLKRECGSGIKIYYKSFWERFSAQNFGKWNDINSNAFLKESSEIIEFVTLHITCPENILQEI
jgi:hypothetical protein